MHTELKIGRTLIGAGLIAALAGCSTVPRAPDAAMHGTVPAEPAAVAAPPASPRTVAETFNRALAMGDAGTVRTLLLPNVLIYESGGAETSMAEYAGHHMPADMAFMANMRREHLSQESGGDNTNAWVATRSRLSGRFKDKDLDLDSTETLVMSRTEAGWRIVHVHWSSAPHKSAKP